MSPTPSTAVQLCPRCGYRMTEDTCINRDAAIPKPGDLAVCFACGAPMIFTDAGTRSWLHFDSITDIEGDAKGWLFRAVFGILTRRPSRVRFTK